MKEILQTNFTELLESHTRTHILRQSIPCLQSGNREKSFKIKTGEEENNQISTYIINGDTSRTLAPGINVCVCGGSGFARENYWLQSETDPFSHSHFFSNPYTNHVILSSPPSHRSALFRSRRFFSSPSFPTYPLFRILSLSFKPFSRGYICLPPIHEYTTIPTELSSKKKLELALKSPVFCLFIFPFILAPLFSYPQYVCACPCKLEKFLYP